MLVGITGHQAMPESARDYADAAIGQYIASNENIEGISSLAAGADQMFAIKIWGASRPLHAIIPCNDYESTFNDENDLAKYTELLAASTSVETLDYDVPSEEAFYAAGRRVAEKSEVLLAVWDGKDAQGLGGTADVVRYARSMGKTVLIIWPKGVER